MWLSAGALRAIHSATVRMHRWPSGVPGPEAGRAWVLGEVADDEPPRGTLPPSPRQVEATELRAPALAGALRDEAAGQRVGEGVADQHHPVEGGEFGDLPHAPP